MTENLKKYLEAASSDKAYAEKLSKAKTPEAVIALAAEKGFSLTEEDLKPQPASGEMSDAELDAVTGGDKCMCMLGGYGAEAGSDYLCVCPLAGGGGASSLDEARCVCVLGGHGTSTNP